MTSYCIRRRISIMAKKEELEELGRKFIDLEIEVLNKTNTSIFENGIYNQEFKDLKDWGKGIEEFLMFDRRINKNYSKKDISIYQIKSFYQDLATFINSVYIRFKETLNDVDRLNLKVYLQITEILEQEQKIYDLEKYRSSEEVIKSLEYLNNIVISSYARQLKTIQEVMNDDKLKEAMKVVATSKNKEEIKKHFTDNQMKDFEFLYNLTKPGNENELEAEIKKAQESIKEAKKRQKGYEQEKKDKVKLEELKKNKNTANNFFNNNQAIESTIKVLNNCCKYYYSLIFLNEFMNCLSILDIQNEFYFMKPLDLMSYSKLQYGLENLLTILNYKKIRNKEFEFIAYKFINLELFYKDNKLLYKLRQDLHNALKIQNRKDIIGNVVKLEENFLKTLETEKGW